MRIVVIGGGILGACTAYELVRAGAETILLDRAHEGRATSAGAGIVCPWTTTNADPDYYRMALCGALAHPRLAAALAEDGETDLGYARVGTLVAPADPAVLDEVERIVRTRAATSPEAGAVRRLSSAEARRLFPPLVEGRMALHVEGGARLDGRRLGAALHRAVAKRGGVVRNATAELLMENDRLRGVRADGEAIHADAVVLAAGAWAPALLAPLCLRLRVQPQRGQIIHLRLEGKDTSRWPVLYPMTAHYLLAFEDRVVIGATRETGSGFDYRLIAGGVHQVLSEGLAVAPGLAGATLLETRIGFRPMGPDDRPLLGTAPGLANLVIANGLGPSGLTIGPYAGALAATLALGGTPEIDLAPYDPLRE